MSDRIACRSRFRYPAGSSVGTRTPRISGLGTTFAAACTTASYAARNLILVTDIQAHDASLGLVRNIRRFHFQNDRKANILRGANCIVRILDDDIARHRHAIGGKNILAFALGDFFCRVAERRTRRFCLRVRRSGSDDIAGLVQPPLTPLPTGQSLKTSLCRVEQSRVRIGFVQIGARPLAAIPTAKKYTQACPRSSPARKTWEPVRRCFV